MISTAIQFVFRFIQRLEEILLAAAILVIAGLTIVNVICRSVFDSPLAFAEEVSQYCIIVVCFVGLSYAASRGRHIRMTALYDQQSKRWRKISMIAITGSTALLLFVLTWYACEYVHTVYQLGGIYPVLRVPFFVVYATAPLGLFLGGLQYTLAMIRNLIDDQVYLSYEVPDVYEEPVTQEI
jgi:C4-dicarboxylate transporter, DctQ subunit